MTNNKDFDAIVYHEACPDGIASLWCANYYKMIDKVYPCRAGKNPTQDLTGLNILFVDICPQLDYLLELVKIAKYVVILDHHKSAETMINDNKDKFSEIDNLHIIFDMTKSGCQITWDYFFDDKPRPFFIDYIGDRDLWLWKLPKSKEINMAIYKLNYINRLSELLENPEEKIKYLEEIGNIFVSSENEQIEIGIKNAIDAKFNYEDKTYRIWLGGNINPQLRSEFGNLLCDKEFNDNTLPDFAAIWQYDPLDDNFWISFRGNKNRSPDLSVITSKYGGGGHPMAAGGVAIKKLKDLFIF